MDRSYWEKIAPAYELEIFDVLRHDEKKLIQSAINKFADPSKTAMDVGCAVGKWLPVLSPLFRKVYAVDISARNLSIARNNYPSLKNIAYQRLDMSKPGITVPRCDVAVCINAILSASLKKRRTFFNTLSSIVKRSGQLILVIPSLESYLLTHIISHQWRIDRDVLAKRITAKAAQKNWENILQGNVPIDEVPTKHYMQEELRVLLDQVGFKVNEFSKIEYRWETEFLRPPSWLKEPYPWDWLCVATRQ